MWDKIITLKDKSYTIITICIPIRFTKFLVDKPLIIIFPESYWSKPPSIFNKVVLPEPLGPKIATNSLCLKSILTPSSAVCLNSPVV